MEGETVSWSPQEGLTDPENALASHFLLNNPQPDMRLFAYRHKPSHRPLTKSNFISCLAQAARAVGEDPLQGHGIRIGSTLEYLLRGVPFDGEGPRALGQQRLHPLSSQTRANPGSVSSGNSYAPPGVPAAAMPSVR